MLYKNFQWGYKLEDIGCGNWYRIVRVQRRGNSSGFNNAIYEILGKGKKKYYVEAPERGVLINCFI